MPKKHLRYIQSEPASAQQNMDRDSLLLQGLEHDLSPFLHFYEWEKPSATYGYFSRPEKYFDPKGIEKYGLQLGRRPTGGGIVFHVSDLAFSVGIPASHARFSMNTLENYALINQVVALAIKKYMNLSENPELFQIDPNQTPTCSKSSCSSFCMALPTKYDLMIEGKKVGGAAQRRMKYGLLHQGTIALKLPSEEFLSEILLAKESGSEGEKILKAMQERSQALLEEKSDLEVEKIRNVLKKAIVEELIQLFNCDIMNV